MLLVQSARKRHICTKEVSEQNCSVLSMRINACSLMELSGTQPQHSIYRDIHWITKLQLKAWAIALFLLSVLTKQKPHSRQQNSLCWLWSLPISLCCWVSSGDWLPCSVKADFEWTSCKALLEIVHPHTKHQTQQSLFGENHPISWASERSSLAVNRVMSCLYFWAHYE